LIHVTTVRERDKAVILDVVRRFGPLSRVEIHELTHLRPATISLLTRELIRGRRVREAGLSNNPTGRKQILLQMNEDAGRIAAVDFDAEVVTAAVLDCCPKIRGRVVTEKTNLQDGVEGLLRQLFACVRLAAAETDIETTRLLGVGVGDPGLIDPREGISILSSTIPFWRDVPLRARFEQELQIPCVVANNTRTKTIAERMLGAGERADDMIFIEYGRGVGCGIFSGGRTLDGSRYAAGEFGHTHVTENGPPCSCGSFGCLEAVAGISALEMKMKRALAEGGYSRCIEYACGEIGRITGWEVLETARDGDKLSTTLVEEIGNDLGLGIANLVNLFNPSLVLLDRRLALAGDLLINQIKRTVRREALAHSTEHLQFRFAALGSEAGLLGAALIVLDTLFEVPAFKPPKFLLDHTLHAKAKRSAHRRAAGSAD
jgi:N-acetylglucosamine repressor